MENWQLRKWGPEDTCSQLLWLFLVLSFLMKKRLNFLKSWAKDHSTIKRVVNSCTPMLTAALSINMIANTWNQPKCPSTEQWIKMMWYRYTQWNTQFSSVAQSCPTLGNPMDCSTPGLPVHHRLPGFIQTHVHWVGDAIQPSHPPSSPSPPALNLSQGLFKWVSTLH